jgi:hypothetical protein
MTEDQIATVVKTGLLLIVALFFFWSAFRTARKMYQDRKNRRKQTAPD